MSTNAARQLRQPPGTPAGGQFAETRRDDADFALGDWGSEQDYSFEDYLAEAHDPDTPFGAGHDSVRPALDLGAALDDEVLAAGVDLGLVEHPADEDRKVA